ncbi:unnamed protein product [Larinioides sclopetarius]|uniref:Uncharacterized protein n=1 Tax=Larinioides sclopetarius TaxID=280406 RepID=A0AAV1ZPU8_9ARAC
MATLKVEYTIDKFAPLFVISFSQVNCVDPDLTRCFGEFMNDETSKAISDCIKLLLKEYKDITDKISIEEFEDKLYVRSKREYMEQLVSRCLKLSEGEPTFFEFLLVCVYICKFSECIHAKYKCFKILKVTADCLETVYCMKYWNYFKEHDDFLGFADFCRSFKDREPSYKYANGEGIFVFSEAVDPKRNEKVKILGCLNVVDNVISLSGMGKKLTVNKQYFIPSRQDVSEDFLVRWHVMGGFSEDVDLKEWVDVPEKMFKTGICCGHCYAKCFQYPKDLVNEIKSYEVVRQ